MKQKIRLGDSYALSYRLSAYWRNQLLEIFRKHKRKPSSRRRFHTKPRGGDPPSSVPNKEFSCVQTPAKAPALPGLGLAMGMTIACTLLLCLQVKAQFPKPSELMVKIGEELPEHFYNQMHSAIDIKTGAEITIRMADYRDKLLILDFWASWCSACIRSIDHLDSLRQAGFDDGYIVLPVTSQGIRQIERFVTSGRWSLTSVINDTLLSAYFPHRGIPHQVWIKGGRVLGMPRHVYATKANISAAIAGEGIQAFHQTENAVLDLDLPLFEGENGDAEPLAIGKYGVFFPYVEGYQATRTTYRNDNKHSVLYSINIGLDLMLREVYRNHIFGPFRDTYDRGIEWHLEPETQEMVYPPASGSYDSSLALDLARKRWKQRYTFGYRQYAALNTSHQVILDRMKHDIQTALMPTLGLMISPDESGKERYLELRILGTTWQSKELLLRDVGGQSPKIETTDTTRHYWGYPFGNQFHTVVFMAAQQSPNLGITAAALIDSTGIDPQLPVSFWFPNAMNGNWEQIQKELGRYGMELVLREGPVPVIRVEANRSNREYRRKEGEDGQM